MNLGVFRAVQTDVAGKARWREKYTPEEAREEIRSKAALSEVLGTPTGVPETDDAKGWSEEVARDYLLCADYRWDSDTTGFRGRRRRDAEVLRAEAARIRQQAERLPAVGLEGPAERLEFLALAADDMREFDEQLRGRQANSTLAFEELVLRLRGVTKPTGKGLSQGEIALSCIALELPEASSGRHTAIAIRVGKALQRLR